MSVVLEHRTADRITRGATRLGLPVSIGVGMALSLGLAACGSPPEATPGTEAVASPSVDVPGEVATFLDGYLEAISARDEAGLHARVVADGFRWVEEGVVRYRSVESMLASLAQFPPDMAISTDIHELEVTPVGENAAHAVASFTTLVGEGEGGFSFGGVMTFVLERVDGWRIVGGHVSSPPAEGERGG